MVREVIYSDDLSTKKDGTKNDKRYIRKDIDDFTPKRLGIGTDAAPATGLYLHVRGGYAGVAPEFVSGTKFVFEAAEGAAIDILTPAGMRCAFAQATPEREHAAGIFFDDGADDRRIQLRLNAKYVAEFRESGLSFPETDSLATVTVNRNPELPMEVATMQYVLETVDAIETEEDEETGLYYSDITPVGFDGPGPVDEDLITYTLLADTLAEAGESLQIDAWGTFAPNANSKRVKLYLGAALLIDSGVSAFNGSFWHITTTVIRVGSGTLHFVSEWFDSYASTGITTKNGGAGEFLTLNQIIKCVGNATSMNDIIQNGLLVRTLAAGGGGTGGVSSGDAISIHTRPIASTAPTDGQALIYELASAQWKPKSIGVISVTTIPPTPTVNGPPVLLVARQRGGLPGMFRLTGGTVLAGPTDGATFAAAEAGSVATAQLAQVNDVAEFNGKHYFLHTSGTSALQFYERQPAGTWTLIHSLSIGHTSAQRSSLFVVNNGQGAILCAFTITGTLSSRTLTMVSTEDGITWTNTTLGGFTVVSGSSNWRKPTALVHRGTVYCMLQNPADVTSTLMLVIDVRGLTFAAALNAPLVAGSGSIATIYGRVFVLMNHAVYEYTGGGFTSIAALANGGSAVDVNNGQPLLFADGDEKLVAIYFTSTAGTLATTYWRAADIEFATPTDVAPTVTQRDNLIPTTLRSAGVTTNKGQAGFFAHIDTKEDPGNPQVYIWYAVSMIGNFQFAKYQDSLTELIGTSVGVTPTNYAFSFERNGGGERASADDLTDVRFSYVRMFTGTGGSGSSLIKFKFQALDVTKTYTAKVFITTTEGTQYGTATLTGTATGATRVGNELQGCAHDTEVQCNLDASTMGIANGSPVRIVVRLVQE